MQNSANANRVLARQFSNDLAEVNSSVRDLQTSIYEGTKTTTWKRIVEIATVASVPIGIAAIIIAIIYAQMTNDLTKKYGDLSVESANNKDQLNKLTEIACNQNSQNDKLISIINELKVQSKGQVSQYQLEKIQFDNNRKFDSLVNQSNVNQLALTLREISAVIPVSYIDSLKYKAQIVSNCVALLKRESKNLFLINNDSLNRVWKVFTNQTESIERKMTGKFRFPDIFVPNAELLPTEEYYEKYEFRKFRNLKAEFDKYFLVNFFNKYQILF
jgi:hypothetical protein